MQAAFEKILIYKKFLLDFNFEVWKQTCLGKIDLLKDQGVDYGSSRNDSRDFTCVNIYSRSIRLLYIG